MNLTLTCHEKTESEYILAVQICLQIHRSLRSQNVVPSHRSLRFVFNFFTSQKKKSFEEFFLPKNSSFFLNKKM
jgi:hypothetical protein